MHISETILSVLLPTFAHAALLFSNSIRASQRKEGKHFSRRTALCSHLRKLLLHWLLLHMQPPPHTLSQHAKLNKQTLQSTTTLNLNHAILAWISAPASDSSLSTSPRHRLYVRSAWASAAPASRCWNSCRSSRRACSLPAGAAVASLEKFRKLSCGWLYQPNEELL